jgi:hypothetical protein
METQAYIEITPTNGGEFQFGLVTGSIDGDLEDHNGKERFVFTWEGAAEMDEASGSGWLQISSKGEVEGLIKMHGGDRSTFHHQQLSPSSNAITCQRSFIRGM